MEGWWLSGKASDWPGEGPRLNTWYLQVGLGLSTLWNLAEWLPFAEQGWGTCGSPDVSGLQFPTAAARSGKMGLVIYWGPCLPLSPFEYRLAMIGLVCPTPLHPMPRFGHPPAITIWKMVEAVLFTQNMLDLHESTGSFAWLTSLPLQISSGQIVIPERSWPSHYSSASAKNITELL